MAMSRIAHCDPLRPAQKPRSLRQLFQDLGCYEDREAEINQRLLSEYHVPFQYSWDPFDQPDEDFSVSSLPSPKKQLFDLVDSARDSHSRIKARDLTSLFKLVLKRPFSQGDSFKEALENISLSRHEQQYLMFQANHTGLNLQEEKHCQKAQSWVEDSRKRLWNLYEDVESFRIPLSNAEQEYYRIWLQESPRNGLTSPDGYMDGEMMASWLQSLGIPPHHIPTEEREAALSGAVSSSYSETSDPEDYSIKERSLAESQIQRKLASYVRRFRGGSLSDKRFCAKTRKAMGGLHGDDKAILKMVRESSKSALGLSDQLWTYYMNEVSTSSSSSGSPCFSPDEKGDDNDYDGSTSEPKAKQDTRQTDSNEQEPPVKHSDISRVRYTAMPKCEALPDCARSMPLGDEKARSMFSSPDHNPVVIDKIRERRDSATGLGLPPQPQSPRLSYSLPRSNDDYNDHHESKVRAAASKHRTVRSGSKCVRDRSWITYPKRRSQSTESYRTRDRLCSSSKGIMTDKLWGLPMTTKEARELGRRLNLPHELITPASLRGSSGKVSSQLKVTIAPLKRKASRPSNDLSPTKISRRSHQTRASTTATNPENGALKTFRVASNCFTTSPFKKPGSVELAESCSSEQPHEQSPQQWDEPPRLGMRQSTMSRLEQISKDVASYDDEPGRMAAELPAAQMSLLAYLSHKFQVRRLLRWLRYLKTVTDHDLLFGVASKLLPCAMSAVQSDRIKFSKTDMEVMDILNGLHALRSQVHGLNALGSSLMDQVGTDSFQSSVLNSPVKVPQQPEVLPLGHCSEGISKVMANSDIRATPSAILPVIHDQLPLQEKSMETPDRVAVAALDIDESQPSNVLGGPLTSRSLGKTPSVASSESLERPIEDFEVKLAVGRPRSSLMASTSIENSISCPIETVVPFVDARNSQDPSSVLKTISPEPEGRSVAELRPPAHHRDSGASASLVIDSPNRDLSYSESAAICTEGLEYPASHVLQCRSILIPQSLRSSFPYASGSELPRKAGLKWQHMSPEPATILARRIARKRHCKSLSFYLEQRRAVRSRISNELENADMKWPLSRYFHSSNGPSSSSTSAISNLNKLFDKYRGMAN